MTLINAQQLVLLYRCSYVRAAAFAEHLNPAMLDADITTPARIAAFLAQIGHESGRLAHTREIWGPTDAQRRYERDPASPWPTSAAQARQAAYARNRLAYNLGNSEPGDGVRYKGRGLIQLTGRTNYGLISDATGEDFLTYPALLETPKWAARSAAWYWAQRKLNAHADAADFDEITRRINGGQNGRADRIALHTAAQIIIT